MVGLLDCVYTGVLHAFTGIYRGFICIYRSKELEASQCNIAALQGVGIQAVVTEFLITNADLLFDDKFRTYNNTSGQHRTFATLT